LLLERSTHENPSGVTWKEQPHAYRECVYNFDRKTFFNKYCSRGGVGNLSAAMTERTQKVFYIMDNGIVGNDFSLQLT